MPNKPPAYQNYAKDWLVDTAHLTLEEQGAYKRLLDHQWIEGPLPSAHDELARRLAIPSRRFERLWVRIGRFFPATDDGSVANPRLERERAKQLRYRAGQAAKRQAASPPASPQLAITNQRASPPASHDPAVCSLQSALTTTQPTVAAEPQGISPNGVVAGMIRTHCYPPDGKEPPGHDIARDIRWWNVRVAKYQDSVGRLEMALKGAPLVVEKLRGVKWSPAKMFTKQGEWADLFERSITAAGKDRKATKGPLPIGKIMDDAMAKARRG